MIHQIIPLLGKRVGHQQREAKGLPFLGTINAVLADSLSNLIINLAKETLELGREAILRIGHPFTKIQSAEKEGGKEVA